jgi:hypothetical protein
MERRSQNRVPGMVSRESCSSLYDMLSKTVGLTHMRLVVQWSHRMEPEL